MYSGRYGQTRAQGAVQGQSNMWIVSLYCGCITCRRWTEACDVLHRDDGVCELFVAETESVLDEKIPGAIRRWRHDGFLESKLLLTDDLWKSSD